MARGMANDEPIVSQASTKEYEEACDRIFGPDRKPQRGRWVWDEKRKEMVPIEESRAEARALDAPVMSGRFYENLTTLEGEDIGSREKYQRYMREKGVTNMSDFSDGWYARLNAERKRDQAKARRDAVARAVYEKFKP